MGPKERKGNGMWRMLCIEEAHEGDALLGHIGSTYEGIVHDSI